MRASPTTSLFPSGCSLLVVTDGLSIRDALPDDERRFSVVFRYDLKAFPPDDVGDSTYQLPADASQWRRKISPVVSPTWARDFLVLS